MLAVCDPAKHLPPPPPPAASECKRTSTSPKDLLISLPTSVLLMQDGIRIQKKKNPSPDHFLSAATAPITTDVNHRPPPTSVAQR